MEGEMIGDSSGFNCSNNNALPAENVVRNGNNASSGRFKGVVPQQNGHWGAQIYARHQRIWLGTFKSETEAAMAYDSAAIKIRSGDSYRNIPWSNITVREPDFQAQYSSEVVLNMIKDGSYQSKFADFLRDHSQSAKEEVGGNAGDGRLCCKQLFQKELTPSDVGKLNRLVIPKKYAVKYFPPISAANSEQNEDGGSDDVELVFFDKFMRLWKFRYCYWSSSQSYVFTRGWNRFVKEKDLKATETIKFVLCERRGAEENHKFCMIEVDREKINAEGTSHNVGMLVEKKLALGGHDEGEKEAKTEEGEVDVLDLQLALRPISLADDTTNIKEEKMVIADSDFKAMNLELQLALSPSEDQVEAAKADAEAEGFTLFGVHMKKQCLKTILNSLQS